MSHRTAEFFEDMMSSTYCKVFVLFYVLSIEFINLIATRKESSHAFVVNGFDSISGERSFSIFITCNKSVGKVIFLLLSSPFRRCLTARLSHTTLLRRTSTLIWGRGRTVKNLKRGDSIVQRTSHYTFPPSWIFHLGFQQFFTHIRTAPKLI